MTRDEILTRYRRLREVSKQHHAAVLDVIAPHVVMDYAKRLGLTRGKVVVLDRTEDMTLAFDLAIYHCFGSFFVSIGTVCVLPFRYEIRILLISLEKCP
jgi:hypothetical protein